MICMCWMHWLFYKATAPCPPPQPLTPKKCWIWGKECLFISSHADVFAAFLILSASHATLPLWQAVSRPAGSLPWYTWVCTWCQTFSSTKGFKHAVFEHARFEPGQTSCSPWVGMARSNNWHSGKGTARQGWLGTLAANHPWKFMRFDGSVGGCQAQSGRWPRCMCMTMWQWLPLRLGPMFEIEAVNRTNFIID